MQEVLSQIDIAGNFKMSNVLFLFIAFLLLLVNAFFVAAEFGMVKLRHTQVSMIQEMYGLRGKILAQIHKHLDTYLSACQLGITLASLGLGWIGEPAFSYLLEPLFQFFNLTSPEVTKIIAFFTAFSILSFLHIVVGELMPKSLAIRQPESVSIWTAVPLYVFYWLMHPAIWLLNNCANFMLKIIKLDAIHQGQNIYSTEEIKLILTASHLHGELTLEETNIIQHTLEFTDLKVTEVMRPSEEMIALDIQEPIPQLLKKIIKYRYTRYPIYNNNTQEIIGIIHIKDLFSALYNQAEINDLTPLIRPVLKVTHQLSALNLLKKFRSGVSHFALIYRGEILIGFVTLDNLLHIMFGRIRDEFHKTKVDWTDNLDGTFTVKGDCSIYFLERILDRDIDVDEETEINTLTGLIFHRLGAFPKVGERIEFTEFDLVVEKIEGARIDTVKIYIKE
jgi:CBS domain containing-hemolysin-like protein